MTAEVRVGGARVAALPVQFSLSGEGTLTGRAISTDNSGRASVLYLAPLEGEGTAVVSARATLQGIDYTQSYTLTYRLSQCEVSASVPRCYNVTELPDGFTPLRLAADGRVFGFEYNGTYRIKVWENGTLTDLGVLEDWGAGSYISAVADVNDSGIAVGTIISDTHLYNHNAVKWVAGQPTELDWAAEAFAINNRGDVVGVEYQGNYNEKWVKLWAAVPITSFRVADGWAYDINGTGVIAARLYFSTGISTRALAPATWSNGLVERIGGAGEVNCTPEHINDAGYVAGTCWVSTGQYRGFLWNGSQLQRLAPLAGHDATEAHGVNASGHVVGRSWRFGMAGEEPVLWINGAIYTLDRLVDYEDMNLFSGGGRMGINDAGQILFRDYLLTPR